MEGQYRSLSYVGKHQPVVVDEPLHLFGEDTAPAPGEIVLSGLGGCIAVGVTAVATWKGVKLSKLEVFLEGDIGNPAAWGAGGALEKTPPEMGFQAMRVKVLVEGDAPREVLDEIVQHANFYSPVANTMRNPIPFEISMAETWPPRSAAARVAAPRGGSDRLGAARRRSPAFCMVFLK
jgi:uncharacterized OsmC-like protein